MWFWNLVEGIERRERALKALASKLEGGGRVLDLATGSGYLIRHLSRGAVGVDIDREALLRARRELPEYEYVQADATSLPFRDDAFDRIGGWSVLVHVPDWRKVVEEMMRVLDIKGRIVLCEPIGSAVRAFQDYRCTYEPPTADEMKECFSDHETMSFGSRHDGFLLLSRGPSKMDKNI